MALTNDWQEDSRYTLVNRAALLATQQANNENDLPTSEFGKGKFKVGEGEQVFTSDPIARSNIPESQCVALGYHPDHAIGYLNQASADEKCAIWDLQNPNN